MFIGNMHYNQHRGAYDKIALLIVSLVEIYDPIKENSGIAIIKKILDWTSNKRKLKRKKHLNY